MSTTIETTTVKDRLAVLLDADTASTISTVQAYLDPAGTRWLWATQGHALAMVVSDEPAEVGATPKALIEKPHTVVGSVDAVRLMPWVGDYEPPRTTTCDDCDGDGECEHCQTESACPACPPEVGPTARAPGPAGATLEANV